MRKVMRTFYKTGEQAEQRAAGLRKFFRPNVDPQEVAEACRQVSGTGYSIPQLLQIGVEHIRNSGATWATATTNSPWLVTYHRARSPVREYFEPREQADLRAVELAVILRSSSDRDKTADLCRAARREAR